MTNLAAKNLSDRRYRPMVVRPKKGKGSYVRRKVKKETVG